MSRVVIQLMGALSVTGSRGEPLTPRGRKAAALLALLAVAKGRWCSRAWLQDKLWSDRAQRQGRDSLRHAIASLKSALGDHASIVVTRGGDVGLDRDQVLVDIYDPMPLGLYPPVPGAGFLDGMDVCDPEFESWLRNMRASDGHDRPAPGRIVQCGFRVALLPVQSFARDEVALSLGTSIACRVAMSLGNLGPFTVFDFADGRAVPESGADAPDVLLSTRCVRFGRGFSLSLNLRRVLDSQVVWSTVQIVPTGGRHDAFLSELVARTTDQIAHALHKPGVLGPADCHQAARSVLCGIDRMFSLGADGLSEADAAFTRATELEPKGEYYAWHAYLTVVRTSEEPSAHADDLKSLASTLAARALSTSGSNPLTLALLTQVYAFVFRDYERAKALIEPAIALSPDSLMVLDSLALLSFYTGHLSEARVAAARAMEAALHNPYRYCFATTLCMIETVDGDYESAVAHGERALAMHRPSSRAAYAPTLRYLTAAYENANRPENARRTYAALRAQEPALEAARMDPIDYPIPNPEAMDILASSFRRIESGTAEF